MYCTECGRKISDEVAFCPYCGAQQPHTDPEDNDYEYEQPDYTYEQPDNRYKRADTGYRNSDNRYRESDAGYRNSDNRYRGSDTNYRQPRYSSYDPDEEYRRTAKRAVRPQNSRPSYEYEDDRDRYERPVRRTRTKTTYTRTRKKEKHSPAGIIFVLILTVGLFGAVVYFTKYGFPKISLPKSKTTTESSVSESTQQAEDGQDPIVGSYTATSAVYNGVKMNSIMLKVSGYTIAFDVRADATFTATLNDETYEGTWSRNESQVEFTSGDKTFTGEFQDGVLSLSNDEMGISVVLEK